MEALLLRGHLRGEHIAVTRTIRCARIVNVKEGERVVYPGVVGRDWIAIVVLGLVVLCVRKYDDVC